MCRSGGHREQVSLLFLLWKLLTDGKRQDSAGQGIRVQGSFERRLRCGGLECCGWRRHRGKLLAAGRFEEPELLPAPDLSLLRAIRRGLRPAETSPHPRTSMNPLGHQKDGSPAFGSNSAPDLLITSRFACPSDFDPIQPMSQLHPQLMSGQR